MNRHPDYSTLLRIREKLQASKASVEGAFGFGGDYVIMKGAEEDPEPFVFSRDSSLWTQHFSQALAVHPGFDVGFLGGHVVGLEEARKAILDTLERQANPVFRFLSPEWHP